MSVEDEVIEICRQAIGKGYERRPLQEEAIKRIIKWLENGAEKPFILRLPTGYGKTLIGLAPALYQLANNDWRYFRSLVYVLPMRALCSQVVNSTRQLVRKLLPSNQAGYPLIKEFHGGVAFSGRFAGDIIVATYDTFVYAYSRKLGAMLDYPAGTLATSMIVLDEAQMIQDEKFYSYSLLEKVLDAFVKSGVPILLMTATLPEKIKQTIFRKVDVEDFRHDIGEEKFRGSIREIQLKKGGLDIGTIRESIERYREYFGRYPRRVFIVFNSVERLRNVWRDLHCRAGWEFNPSGHRYKLVCLHAMQKNIERRSKVDEITKLCGSPERNMDYQCSDAIFEGVILLSTQVIEAGLDISSDLLITECAPLDSIVQRMGRCARFKKEEGFVVITDVRDARPYPSALVNASWAAFEECGQEITVKLQDYQKVSELIDDIYNKWEPKEIEPDLLCYVSYLERSLGPLNGDLETARSLRFRLDDYIEVVVPDPNSKLECHIAEEDQDADGWKLRIRKGPFLIDTSRLVNVVIHELQENQYLLLTGGGYENGSTTLKDIDEWVSENSVSVDISIGGLPDPIVWKFDEDKKLLLMLAEVPERKIEGLSKPAALVRMVKGVTGMCKTYLGNPSFYEKDIGLLLNKR